MRVEILGLRLTQYTGNETQDMHDESDRLSPHEIDPRNVVGEFYVKHGCCTLCGVPWHYAPELFSYDDNGCWVSRQPVEPDERRKMLKVIAMQELGCIRSRQTAQPEHR